MKILVSGGFGFIGSHLIPYLLGQNVSVGVIARRIPPSFDHLATEVDCHIHDLGESPDIGVIGGYDCFVHLAGSLHSASSTTQDMLSRTLDVTRHCLEVCRANRISRFVHFSTFQVYGRDHGYIDERTPVDCRNDYARAHHLAEEQVRLAHREGIVEYVILRPTNGFGFSSHGDVQRWSLVPACFCRSAVDEGEIVLRTSGLQQKDFIHLHQMASLTHSICMSFDRFRNEVVNLASGCSHAIVDVAKLVQSSYERISGVSCGFRVLSTSPAGAEPLVVSRARTAELPYVPALDLSLATDINRTLSYLTS